MKKDTVTKDYMSDAAVFADAFNYYIYGGEQMIQPEHLTEQDPVEIALPYGADGASVPIQRLRDVQKLCAVMTDGKAEYILCGVENQAEIHYAMAVKNYLYDALEYAGQVERTARFHREAMEVARRQKRENSVLPKVEQEGSLLAKKPNSGEFLGGFWKEDRLIPSVTLTIYFGCDEWDGPLSLFDMMEVTDTRVLSCMDNYHVRLIAPVLMADEEIMKFQSSLREVLLFIKYSKDKKALKKILDQNKLRFQRVERRAVDVINVITGTGLKYEESEVEVDVCQAILEMRMEAEKIGEQRGEKIGEKRGEQRGEQIGALKKARESAERFYKMGMEVEKVAEGLGCDVDTVREWLKLTV